jgi:hypothetical protein
MARRARLERLAAYAVWTNKSVQDIAVMTFARHLHDLRFAQRSSAHSEG